MPKTSCKAEMKFIDVSALADASISVLSNQTVGNTNLLSGDDAVNQSNYATLELNRFVLDGSKTILTDTNSDIAYWSAISGDDCTFSTNPKYTAIFTQKHSCAGLTLYFADDYPTEIKVTYYTLNGSKIIDKTFYPDSLIYVCKYQCENFGKIEIEFVKTRLPYSYVKLQYVLFGLYLYWQDDLIKMAKVHEEIDQTSATLPINTAEISLIDKHYDFDIANENGAWKSVQKTQKVTLTENKDGVDIPIGAYFISEKSFTDNVANFSLIGRIGLLDGYMFREGKIYANETVEDILQAIFSSANCTEYTISDDVKSILLSGYLGIMTCRQALQMVCFACGAVADDSRSDVIRIYKPSRGISTTIGTDRKLSGKTKITLDEYVSGVSIECKKYTLESDLSEIYNDTLPTGITTIEFSEPYQPSSLIVTGGTLITAKTNYAVIQMVSSGTCVLSGKKYKNSGFTIQKNVPVVDAGESVNVKSFKTITLYNMDTLRDKAESLLSYYSLRKKLSMQYLIETEQVGKWANVKDVSGNVATTLLESQDIDLTGGFLSNTSCRGYSVVVTDFYYADSELYAGQEGII